MPLIVAASCDEAAAIEARLGRGRVHRIGVGKVASALAAQRLILDRGARAVLLVGVAGGIAPWLEPLDAVIAATAVQWDVDLTAVNGGERGRLNDGRRLFTADPAAGNLAAKAAESLGYRVYRGRVASGDSFIAGHFAAAWIRSAFEADAVDVETAAVAQAADDLGVPFLSVRVISDNASSSAPAAYRATVEAAADRAARIAGEVARSWQAHLDGVWSAAAGGLVARHDRQRAA